MEMLPFIFILVIGVGFVIYTIIKCAVKDALKEYFENKK